MNVSLISLIIYGLIILGAYLIGAIPTGYIISKLFGNINILKKGSGNIGASNVGRELGKKFFFLVFFIDAGKALCAVKLSVYLLDLFFISYNFYFLFFTSLVLLLGNCFSVFLKFYGGKGVATSIGILLALYPLKLSLFFMLIWGIIFFITYIPSYASLGAISLTVIFSSFFDVCEHEKILFLWLILTLVIIRHWDNIVLLRKKFLSGE
jgi:glycerol-3-phosphate acyltransferase PlsY